MMATGNSKHKTLTLNEKLEAIRKPAYKIAEEFGVGKTQIQSLRKRKAEVLADFENNVPGSCKRRLDAIYWLYSGKYCY
jgi:kinesin family protein 6/9